jgi:hypothetical protein
MSVEPHSLDPQTVAVIFRFTREARNQNGRGLPVPTQTRQAYASIW